MSSSASTVYYLENGGRCFDCGAAEAQGVRSVRVLPERGRFRGLPGMWQRGGGSGGCLRMGAG